MPRRRHHRRLEWSNSMQSHVTLVDQPLDQSLQVERRTHISVPVGADTFGADNLADARPSHTRATQPSVTQASRRATRSQTLPSETTGRSAVSENSASAKPPMSVMRRLRDSLRRQLRNLGHSVLHVPENPINIH
ncbi:hypothetical protein LPJ73_004803 [Coemansia sp. RSA 2703]|nr:hypothetical protein LPJ73_004803 [Coemansia sp. RSA 2703]KAJ2375242.1 hypothetical protein IW150_002655 [Coemansia sp. RSA 2607]